MEEEASINPGKASDLLYWLATTKQSLLALDWIKGIDPNLLGEPPVFVGVADCYVAAGDWANLEKWCRKFDWKDLDFLRHAYLAYALGGLSRPLDGDLEWSKALQEASTGDELYTLEQDAVKWGWQDRSIEVMWRLGDDRDKQGAALAALYQYYSGLSDTGNLYRVASHMKQVSPNDLRVQNNWAQLALLLKVDVDSARATAQQLHEREPANADYASTYAYALVSQGKTQEALKMMGEIPEQELQKPSIAAYYGIILSRAGQHDRAAKFLEAGRQAKLLPEEKSLVEAAIRRR